MIHVRCDKPDWYITVAQEKDPELEETKKRLHNGTKIDIFILINIVLLFKKQLLRVKRVKISFPCVQPSYTILQNKPRANGQIERYSKTVKKINYRFLIAARSFRNRNNC